MAKRKNIFNIFSGFGKNKKDEPDSTIDYDANAFDDWSQAILIINNPEAIENHFYFDKKKVLKHFDKISFYTTKLSWNCRKYIIDNAIILYNVPESKYETPLIHLCFEMCYDRDDWLYLANRLYKYDSKDNRRLLMQIYYNIGDNETYLELRKDNLSNGYEFYDLVMFYESVSDMEFAIKTAYAGLKRAINNLDPLINYLFNYYSNNLKSSSLEELVRLCDLRKIEQYNVSTRMFEYYKHIKNYEGAKKYLLRLSELVSGTDLYNEYIKTEEYLTPTDFKEVNPQLLWNIQQQDILGYMKICMNNGQKQAVLDTLFTNLRRESEYSLEYAEKLKYDYPDKIIEYYFKVATYYIVEVSNRNAYIKAIEYYLLARDIYVNILRQPEQWSKKLSEIRLTYKSRRALIEEMTGIE